MTQFRPWSGRTLVAGGVLALLLCMVSCRSTGVSPLRAAEGVIIPGASLLASTRDSVLTAFGPQDHVQLTSAGASQVLSESKARPSDKAGVKRCLTLEDCRAIALKNNLELHMARLDELTKEAIKDRNLTRFFPHFTFSGELIDRDNPLYSYSDVLGQEGIAPTPESGTGVTNYATGRERTVWRYSLETRWSPVDAALACYVAKSSFNDRLKAHHQRVRAAQRLVGAVDAAYFRLLAAQEALSSAQQLVAGRNRISGWMRNLQDKMIIRIEEYERVEQKALEARRLLTKTRNEMDRQRSILLAAMGLPPESCAGDGFWVEGKMSRPTFDARACELELMAVKNRPESYQAGLDHLTSLNDIKRAIIRYLPRVEGFWRFTRDKDKYLYNKDWKEVGLIVQVDLLDWLSNGHESRAAKSTAERMYKEVGAVALAISSQVRLAALSYDDALDELRTREASVAGSQKVLETARVRGALDDLSRLDLEEAAGNLLQHKFQRIRALGEANASLAELQTALGTNYHEALPRH